MVLGQSNKSLVTHLTSHTGAVGEDRGAELTSLEGLGLQTIWGKLKACMESGQESGRPVHGHEWTRVHQPGTSFPRPLTLVACSDQPLRGGPAQALRPEQGVPESF